MLRPQKVLRREKGTRSLLPSSIEAAIQNLQGTIIQEPNPLAQRPVKYRQLQSAIEQSDLFLEKSETVLRLLQGKSEWASTENALASTREFVQEKRDAYQTQLAKLETFLEEEEHKQGLESLKEYQQAQTNEKAQVLALQQEAKAIFKQRGALCDSEGYYQHTGECWSDTLQQVFFNADGLKEISQRHLIVYPEVDTRNLPDILFTPFLSPVVDELTQDPLSEEDQAAAKEYVQQNQMFIQLQKQWVSLYLHEIKKRFLRHYLTEATRRVILETCSLKQPGSAAMNAIAALSKEASRRTQGREGMTSAILGKLGVFDKKTSAGETLTEYYGLATPSLKTYAKENVPFVKGGDSATHVLLMNLYNHIFFSSTLFFSRLLSLEDIPTYLYDREQALKDMRAVFLITGFDDPRHPGTNAAHMFACYTCGGNEFLYDDNAGLIPFQWKLFFQKVFELAPSTPTLQFVTYRQKTPRIYLKTEFYPILVLPTTPPTYGVVLDGVYSEGTSLPASLTQQRIQTLEEMTFVIQSSMPSLQNTSFEFRPEARIGRLKAQDLTSFVKAASEGTEDEALGLLSSIEIPLDLTVPAPKTGVPYPLVYLAVRRHQPRMLEALLKKGFDPNSALNTGPRPGITALMLATTYKRLDLVQLLLQAKADPNRADSKGFRAIHNAVMQLDLPGVEALLAAGADVNAQTATGMTPLFLAASKDSLDLVTYLCSKGADQTLKGAGVEGDPPKLPILAAKDSRVKGALMKCKIRKGGTRRLTNRNRKTRKVRN